MSQRSSTEKGGELAAPSTERQLQHLEEAVEIAVNIRARMVDRVAHAGLGGEMDDGGDVAVARGEALHRRRVGNVEPFEAEARPRFEPRQPVIVWHDCVGSRRR